MNPGYDQPMPMARDARAPFLPYPSTTQSQSQRSGIAPPPLVLPPPPPPPPPSQQPRTPGSAGQSLGGTQHLNRAPVSPSLAASTGFTTGVPHATAQHAPGSPYTPSPSYLSPSNPNSFASPASPLAHGPVTSPHSPHAEYTPSPSQPAAYRSRSGGTGGIGSTMMDYNPQQWGRAPTGQTFSSYRPHTNLTVHIAPRQLDDSGQPLESPPPPYTPNPAQNLNQIATRTPPNLHTNVRLPSHLANEMSTPQSAVTAVASPLTARSRAEAPMNFPPPPPNSTRDRSASRSRFGLSALARGRSTERSNTTPPNAIDNLQYGTREALANAPVQRWDQSRQAAPTANRQTMFQPPAPEQQPLPPAARRSASTGTMSHHHWAPNMPLPPPPGPPPPSSSRSASMSRAGSSYDNAIPVPAPDTGAPNVPIISAPTRRPPPHRGTQLGPVPPTPAGYSEFPQSPMPPQMRGNSPMNDPEPPPPVPALPPSRVADLQNAGSSSSSDQPDASRMSGSSGSWSGSLRREPSAKGIRERRSESRAARDRRPEAAEPTSSIEQSNPQVGPADLILSPVSAGGINRSRAVKKARASPISAGFQNSPKVTGNAIQTPQQPTSARDVFSPQRSAGIKSPPAQVVPLPDSARTIPNSATNPGTATRSSSNSSLQPESGDSFAISSIKRHQDFVRKESSCKTDKERIELFAEYIVTESRLRRDHYTTAFASMEPSDVMDLTRNLWRTLQTTPTNVPRPASTEPSSAVSISSMPHASRTDSMGSFISLNTPMSGSQANFTPLTEPDSPASVASSTGNPREVGPWARHKPVLSPIPSMAMSTVPDEEDSRGRPASRWWESSAGSIGNAQRIERTKRESKFMGLHRQALADLQWQDEPSPSMNGGTPRGNGDYPVEKTGWHDEGAGPSSTPRNIPTPIPPAPDPHQLDVSRLITLPPPYPRHYPAMSNNHPDMASVRQVLEQLRDLDEVRSVKDAYTTKITQRRERATQEAANRCAQMRHNIQEQLGLGQMTYAQAAAAEEDFNRSEANQAHATVRAEYDGFQPQVMTPLHALLSEKITRGNACITQLTDSLKSSSEEGGANELQSEGDEQPELLEKLNLLKWLTEAREALHHALDSLEGERNELYREVIIKPLRDLGDEAKMTGASQFFDQDQRERKANFEKGARKRYAEFASVVEANVTRGVEAQLSAFWDIAPGLSSVVTSIPESSRELATLDLRIPAAEYEENPSYSRYPLQYLHTLLTHASKSAYQFIEAQTNLMCLLHEASTGLMVADIRLLEAQRVAEGEDWSVVHAEMGHVRGAEEERLTRELKEKVETVESQWREGLGSGLEGVQERVRECLFESGGWDEGLLE